MPITPTLGRVWNLYVAAASPVVPGVGTKVGGAFDLSFPQEPKKADLSSNDSGPRDEHRVSGVTGDMDFKCYIDRTDPGQAVLLAAVEVDGTGTGMVYFELHEAGTASGRHKRTGYASVSIKPDRMREGHAVMSVTLSPSGAIPAGTQ